MQSTFFRLHQTSYIYFGLLLCLVEWHTCVLKNRIKQLLFLHCVRPFALLVFSHEVHCPLCDIGTWLNRKGSFLLEFISQGAIISFLECVFYICFLFVGRRVCTCTCTCMCVSISGSFHCSHYHVLSCIVFRQLFFPTNKVNTGSMRNGCTFVGNSQNEN